jgi:putative addiction module component (TIGR02574 family)
LAGDFTGLDKTWGLATVEHMSTSVEAIAADAVRLPPDQRLTLAHRILSSVEPIGSGEVEAAWDVEIRRRIAAHDAGTVAAVSGAEVFAELDRRLRP